MKKLPFSADCGDGKIWSDIVNEKGLCICQPDLSNSCHSIVLDIPDY